MKKFLLLSIVLIVSVSGCFGGFSGSKESKDIGKYENEPEKIIKVFNKNPEIAGQGANKQNSQVEPRPGYEIFSSLLSHDKDMVVYTEVKGRMDDLYKGWEYHISYKNLSNGRQGVIYSFPKDLSWKSALLEFTAEEAKAQNCQALPFPIKWTKNDKKIIFKGIVPVPCSSESISKTGYFAADPEEGVLEPLRYIAFFDGHSKAVVLESGDKLICDSMKVSVNERVVAKDLEFGSKEIMVGDDDHHYRFMGIDERTEMLILERLRIYHNKNKGCYEFVSKSERVEVDLNEFK